MAPKIEGVAMTPDEIEAGLKVCDAAWDATVVSQHNSADARSEYYLKFRPGYKSVFLRREDAEFFVYARNTLSKALRELKTLGLITLCEKCGGTGKEPGGIVEYPARRGRFILRAAESGIRYRHG